MKIVRSENITNASSRFLEKDSLDTCANYVRRLENGNIEVETLYRYARPNISIMTNVEFNAWRTKLEREAAQ